ncbi:MAG: hypothetical protein Q8R01_11155 [Ramlibacter sp.]|nr:hypothetical protein [Ramlibacter sp.]
MNPNESQSVAVAPLVPLCLTRQAAIDYCSVKPSFFDEHVRPHLRSTKAGTSLLFLREDVEQFFKGMFMAAPSSPDAGEHDINVAKPKTTDIWERKQRASTRAQTAAGKSTSSSTAYDFESALRASKTRKLG